LLEDQEEEMLTIPILWQHRLEILLLLLRHKEIMVVKVDNPIVIMELVVAVELQL
tara:strand:- start:243 stop:407 length:165 start_codon:yes stop_codon:yes gene_type:complete